MSKAPPETRWKRRQAHQLLPFRILNFFGIGIAIVCVLATLGFVLMEAHDFLVRK